jgi:hypothetical protein
MIVLREVTELQDREIKTRGCYLHMRHMDSRMLAFERPRRLSAQRTVHDIYTLFGVYFCSLRALQRYRFSSPQ